MKPSLLATEFPHQTAGVSAVGRNGKAPMAKTASIEFIVV
jgi:hypothetical protein